MGPSRSILAKPALGWAVIALVTAATASDAQAASAQARVTQQTTNVSFPDPLPPRRMTIWVQPESVLGHLREYLTQAGRLSPAVDGVLTFPFVRPDRPVVLQSMGSLGGPSALAFTTVPDATLPELLRGGSCRGGKDGLWLCAPNQSAAATSLLEMSYAKAELAHDLKALWLVSRTDSVANLYALRSDIPRTVQSLLGQLPGLSVGFSATAMAETWLYELHHDILEAARGIDPVTLTLDIHKDGSLKGEATAPFGVPQPLRVALQNAPLRAASSLMGVFPHRTQFAISTDAQVLGGIIQPSARVLAFADQAWSDGNGAPVGLREHLTQVHHQCFQRAQDLVMGWGNTADFDADGPRRPPPAKSVKTVAVKQDYWAVGIGDGDGKCATAMTGLWSLFRQPSGATPTGNSGTVQQKPARAKSAGSEPALALPTGMIVTKRLGAATWVVHAADQAGITAVLAEFGSRTKRLRPQAEPRPATIVIRAGRFLEDSSIRTNRALDVPTATTRVTVDNGKLILSFESSRDATRHAMVSAFSGFLDAHQTRQNAELMNAACDLGSDDGCNGAGVAYMDWPQLKDKVKAQRLLEQACTNEHGMACANLGVLQVETAPQQAQKAFARSCDLGTPLGCAQLGNVLLESSDVKDQKLAQQKLSMACDNRIVAACINLGLQHFEGRGVPVDQDQGISYYERACRSHGGGVACVLLGHAYLDGKGRPPDAQKALAMYTRGCELDEKIGCSFAGRLLLWGEGIDHEPEKGKQYLAKACDQGHAESCRQLGDLAGGKP